MPNLITPPHANDSHADLWHIRLNISKEYNDIAVNYLSAIEQERANNLKTQSLRNRFIAAHAALRLILAKYIEESPAEIEYAQDPRGKPYLLNFKHLNFNLSHSRDLALVAITNNKRIGVDLEYINPIFDFTEVSMHFSKEEQNILQRMEPALQRRAFFHCWVRKEALLKALGIGIGCRIDSFAVSPIETEAKLIWINPSLSHDRWILENIPLVEYSAALAIEIKTEIVHQKWDWNNLMTI